MRQMQAAGLHPVDRLRLNFVKLPMHATAATMS
jgi:hypothetical protein